MTSAVTLDSLRQAIQAQPITLANICKNPWFVTIIGGVPAGAITTLLVTWLVKLCRRRWRCFSVKEAAAQMMPKDYGYRSDVYISRTNGPDEALAEAFTNSTKPILLRGRSGVGKTAALLRFLECNHLSAFLPKINDIKFQSPPRTRNTVTVLDNLHEYLNSKIDAELLALLARNTPRVIATIPTWAYEEHKTEQVLSQPDLWVEVNVRDWSESEGRQLATAYNKRFDPEEFDRTALSVVSPPGALRRLYERGSPQVRAVLKALKHLKVMPGYFVPAPVIVAFAQRACDGPPQGCEDALQEVSRSWCVIHGQGIMLRDGVDHAIEPEFTLESANWRTLLAILLEKPVKNWHEIARFMAQRMEAIGMWNEALEVCNKCLAAGCRDPRMLTLRGVLHQNQGRMAEAKHDLEAALRSFRHKKDKSGIASSLHQLGMIAQDQGNYPEARRLYEESLKLERELGNKSGIAISLHQLGMIAQDQGNYPEARRLYEESLKLKRELGDKSGIASSLGQLGRLAEQEKDDATAARNYLYALAIFTLLKSPDAAIAKNNVARVRQRLGDERLRQIVAEVKNELAKQGIDGSNLDKELET